MKRITAFLLIASLLAVALAGCAPAGQTTPPTSQGTSTDSPATATPPADEGPKGELREVFVYSDKNNEAHPSPLFDVGATSSIWDTLYRIDTVTYEPYPLAAADMPQLSEDKRVWTIKLRDDITFHDGEKCTIDDVIFTYNAAYAAGSAFFNLLSAVEGYDKWTAETGRSDTLSGIKKIDDYTMEIHLNQVDTTFLYTLCHGAFSILPKHLLENVKPEEWITYLDYFQSPIGTGPYYISEHNFGNYIVYTANENYFYKKPTVKTIIGTRYEDQAARYAAVVAGEIVSTSCASYADAEALKAQNPDLEIVVSESNYLRLLLPNASGGSKDGKIGPWGKDARFRRAINMIVDKEAIVSYLGGLASVATGFDFTGSPTYNKDLDPWTRDVEGGKALLNEMGFDYNYELRIYTNYTDQVTVDILDIIVSGLAEAGLKATYRCDGENAVDQIYTDKNYDIYYGAMAPTYETITRYDMVSPGTLRDAWWGDDTAQYRTTRYTELVNQYKNTLNEEEKQNIRNQLSINQYEDAYYIPLYFLSGCSVYNTKMRKELPPFPGNLSMVARTPYETYVLID